MGTGGESFHPNPRIMTTIITNLQSTGMTREHAIAWCAAELVKAGKHPSLVIEFMFGAGASSDLVESVYSRLAA